MQNHQHNLYTYKATSPNLEFLIKRAKNEGSLSNYALRQPYSQFSLLCTQYSPLPLKFLFSS